LLRLLIHLNNKSDGARARESHAVVVGQVVAEVVVGVRA